MSQEDLAKVIVSHPQVSLVICDIMCVRACLPKAELLHRSSSSLRTCLNAFFCTWLSMYLFERLPLQLGVYSKGHVVWLFSLDAEHQRNAGAAL